MYTLLKQDGHARRGTFETVHGTVQTPAFMNVGTSAAIKGGISSTDLVELKCQVELCNTYHLHVRPGDDVIHATGRAAQVHELAPPDSDRQRRVPGVFPRQAAQD